MILITFSFFEKRKKRKSAASRPNIHRPELKIHRLKAEVQTSIDEIHRAWIPDPS